MMNQAAESRAHQVRRKLRMHNLLFLQMGAVFDVLRPEIVGLLGAHQVDVFEFCTNPRFLESGTLVLTGLEKFASPHELQSPTLGLLRQRVTEELDKGLDVCLISRVPKACYPKVPGSSLIDDAAICYLPLLEEVLRSGYYSINRQHNAG